MLKKFILGLCLVLVARSLRAVTWTHVNGAAATSWNGVVTLGFTPAAGSLLIVGCEGENSGSASLSISDNSSGPADSWTVIVPYTTSTQQEAEAWATNVTTGTAPTTVTCSSTDGVAVTVDDYTGAPNPFVQDGSAAVAGVGPTLHPSISYTTGTAAGDLLWSFSGSKSQGTSPSISVGSPFTMRETSFSGGAVYQPMLGTSDDGISAGVSASTQYTATYTLVTAEYSIAALVGFEPPPASPATTLSPSSLGFGNQSIKTTSSALTETVINTGGANLVITSDSITGTNAADFTSTADTCSGQTITPTNSCTVSVTFTPSATGSRTAVLSFTDNASSSPQTVGLSGTGVALVNSGHAYIM